MPLDLFPYQHEGAAFLAGKRLACLYDDMGVGKSAQAIGALDAAKVRRAIVVCPASVREVWRGEFKKFGRLPRKILKAKKIDDLGLWLKDKVDVLLVSYEMAVKWAPRLTGDVIETLIFDECFPAGTQVMTEAGLLPIDRIVNGRMPLRVMSQGIEGIELKTITRYVKTANSQVVRIKHESGVLTCTLNHKLWVDGKKYVEAGSIKTGDYLRVLQPAFSGGSVAKEILHKHLRGEMAYRAKTDTSSTDKSNGECSDKGKIGEGPPRLITEDESLKFRSGISRQTGRAVAVAQRNDVARPKGGQRLHYSASENAMRSPRLGRRSNGVSDQHGACKEGISFFAQLLCSRFGLSFIKTSDRDRRSEPQHEEVALPRFSENESLVRSRVESVEIQECRSDEGLTVYNIEVEDNHNYFANDVLVGNCHYMMNDGSKRTIALLGPNCDGKGGLAYWAARVWFLTGTPMPNDPLDIWPMLRFTGATLLDKPKFKSRYFTSRLGSYASRQTPREEMVPELRQVIKSVSLRRTKEQAGLQLPPIFLTTQTVDGDNAEIRALLSEHPGMEQAVLDAVEKGGLSFLDAQHIATLRRLVGEAKAPAFVELLKEELENGLHKVVIMGIHKAALAIVRDGLARDGIDCVYIDGSVGEGARVQAVDRFQRSADCRAFVGNIKAAGTGLTLTAASDLIMFESDWSPGTNAQAIMRVHRVGQTETVRARFISLANSIDERVTDTVARKTAAIGKIGFEMAAIA